MKLQTITGVTFLMLRLKTLLVITFFSINLCAIEVVKTTKDIDYHEIIDASMLIPANVSSVKKYCIPLEISNFKSNKLLAKRYLRKGTILCSKDVEEYTKKSVLFNFGAIEVERPGEVVYENDEYIKIKKIDGKIEKIYKDGRLQ